jgi:hypothetical protein
LVFALSDKLASIDESKPAIQQAGSLALFEASAKNDRDYFVPKVDNDAERNKLSGTDKLKLLVEGTAQGIFTHGASEVTEHPLRLSAELAGGYALGLAMKGPAWVKLPALTIATAGGAVFAHQAVGTISETNKILNRADSSNLEQTQQEIAKTMGPLAFNAALMGLTAKMGTKTELPKEPPKLPIFNGELALPSTSFGSSLRPAYAGVGEMVKPPGNLLPGRNAESEGLLSNIMKMVGGNRSERITSGRGIYGEITHRLDNMQPGERVPIVHADGTTTTFDQSGKILVGFGSGEARLLDLGKPIQQVHASDYSEGIRHFRINGAQTPNLEVNPLAHTVRAELAGGHHLHMVDNTVNGYTFFPHRDGTKTWIEYGGRVVMELPGGVAEHNFVKELAHVRLVERADGSKQFRFLSKDGDLLPHVIELASKSELDAKETAKYLRSLARQAQQQERQQPTLSLERMQPGGIPQASTGAVSDPVKRMLPRYPGSFDRVFDRHIAGVDTRVMRSDSLDSPAQMGLAQQGHSWLVTNYLNHLGGKR